jgi:hypothetical protein
MGWQEIFNTQWIDGRRFLEWSTPLLRSTWEAGPFPLPVDAPAVVEEHYEGPVTVYPLEGGRTRIVYGPWQVVIRGVGARAEGRVVSRWQIETSWIVNMGFERVVRGLTPSAAREGINGRTPGEGLLLGSSEALGASERRWLSASEMRLLGSSELYIMGASELRMRGASEVILGASSDWTLAGGSERRWGGASDWRYGGASETSWLGASEGFGASEGRLGAGSDTRLGASENAPSPYAIPKDDKTGGIR